MLKGKNVIFIYVSMENNVFYIPLIQKECATFLTGKILAKSTPPPPKNSKIFIRYFILINCSPSLILFSNNKGFMILNWLIWRIDLVNIYGHLTHFLPLVSFYTPWKHHKTRGFLMFTGGIERDQWYETGSWGGWRDMCLNNSLLLYLTHFMPPISFYTPWKHQKKRGFLMFSGGIERDQ